MDKQRKANIILINCDDLGYGDLGCYGSLVNATPYIDALAAEGLRMTDFTMASPVCSPSRGAMLTGCYPPRIGFGSFDGNVVLFPGDGLGLSTSETTIADVLSRAGYDTMLVGKWHCGDQEPFLPTNHGFAHYYGLPYSNDMGKQKNRVDSYCPLPLMEDASVIQQQPDLAGLTERYTERAIRFLRQEREGPFFLYMAHMYVHLPHYAPSRFVAESANGDFGAAVACLDWSVGALLHELKALGLEEDTLVVFTSDNGGRGAEGGSNAPLRGAKGSTWEGGQRVPCIFRWPGQIDAGVSSELCCSLDFFRTFAALAGAEVPAGVAEDSLDLTVFLTGETELSPRESFFYYRGNSLDAVRCGRWKLKIADWDTPMACLFDLVADPGESVNLWDAYPEVVADLSARLDACRADLGDARTGVRGTGVREIGRVDSPRLLVEYDANHPFMVAEYDREERG